MTQPALLIAPDSFKGTFTAAEVAHAVGAGAAGAGWHVDLCPVADGGEGTMDVLVAASGGVIRRTTVTGPLGAPVTARFALLSDGSTAVLEMAEASGFGLVAPDRRDAELASSSGTGELIIAAARAGARRILIGVGGSATTDGGTGAIAAIEHAGGLDGTSLMVLCDVSTPFEDAATVFAPQKGADPAAVERLSRRLATLADMFPRDPRGVPMTGCAGGLSGGLWATFNAALVSGADAVLEAVGFDRRLIASAAVVIGEGRLDVQSLTGKITGEIAARCVNAGVPVHAIVGNDGLGPMLSSGAGLASVTEASTLAAIERAAARIRPTQPR